VHDVPPGPVSTCRMDRICVVIINLLFATHVQLLHRMLIEKIVPDLGEKKGRTEAGRCDITGFLYRPSKSVALNGGDSYSLVFVKPLYT